MKSYKEQLRRELDIQPKKKVKVPEEYKEDSVSRG